MIVAEPSYIGILGIQVLLARPCMRLVVLPRTLAMILLRKRVLWNVSETLAIDGVPGMVCIWQVILLTDSCYMEATTSALF